MISVEVEHGTTLHITYILISVSYVNIFSIKTYLQLIMYMCGCPDSNDCQQFQMRSGRSLGGKGRGSSDARRTNHRPSRRRSDR